MVQTRNMQMSDVRSGLNGASSWEIDEGAGPPVEQRGGVMPWGTAGPTEVAWLQAVLYQV